MNGTPRDGATTRGKISAQLRGKLETLWTDGAPLRRCGASFLPSLEMERTLRDSARGATPFFFAPVKVEPRISLNLVASALFSYENRGEGLSALTLHSGTIGIQEDVLTQPHTTRIAFHVGSPFSCTHSPNGTIRFEHRVGWVRLPIRNRFVRAPLSRSPD